MDTPAGKLFLSGTDFLKEPQKQRKWLIEPLIPVSGIVNFYGKPKTGKSFATMGIGLALANGHTEWNGFPVRAQGKVMYLQIDTPEGEMYERIETIHKHGYDVNNVYFADLDIAPYPYNILTPQHQTWLANEIKRIDPLIVFIDTLREAHELNENDSTDMKRVINAIVKISRPAAVGLISHSRKDSVYNAMGAEQDIMDEGRGTSYVPGRMDTVIKFVGNPSKKVGHMIYKGRAKHADGKLPIVQDPDTGLVVVQEDHVKLEHAALKILGEHPDWSNKRIAKMLKDSGDAKSQRTAERRLAELRELTVVNLPHAA